MTRLQRWERADALGLNPPIEVRVTRSSPSLASIYSGSVPQVKEILMTKEATEKSDLAQCVFYGDV